MKVMPAITRMLRQRCVSVLIVCVVVIVGGYYVLNHLEVNLQPKQFIQLYNLTRKDSFPCMKTKTFPPFTICPYDKLEDIYISAALRADGVWERKMTELFQAILKRDMTLTVVDIGANIGYFSLLSASMGHRVVAVEPIEGNLQRFKKGVNLNNFEAYIILLKNAVSSKRQTVTIRLSENNQGAHRILREAESAERKQVTQVNSIKLNDLLQFIETPNVLLKIDVEGHECKVLENAEEFFSTVNVKHIIMEWNEMTFFRHIHGVPCSPIEIVSMTERLMRRGFQAYDVIQNQPIDLQESDKWKYGNVYWRKE